MRDLKSPLNFKLILIGNFQTPNGKTHYYVMDIHINFFFLQVMYNEIVLKLFLE